MLQASPIAQLVKNLPAVLYYMHRVKCTSQVAKWVENPPTMQDTGVQSLGQKVPLEKGMATHSVSLPGKSHGQGSLAGYSLWGCRVGHV